MTRAATTHSDPEPEFESLQSAARRTGYSVFLFREKVANGELVGYRLTQKRGSRIVVRIADVNAMLKPVLPQEVYDDHGHRPRRRNGSDREVSQQ